jgi:hypothetical protein
MTSIIKVDQIQTAAGGVPTAADLGFDVEGSVIATHKFISPTTSDTAITSSSFTTLDTFTLDVKRGNSTMIWWVDTQQYIKSGGSMNLNWRLKVDGVSVGAQTSRTDANQAGLNHVWYQNTSRETLYNHFITQPLTAGSHTFTLDVAVYNGGTITLKYQGGGFRYLVQEIAG